MMHYLSVHDLVWINTIVTGKTLVFDYERLEAVMAAQYGYGQSTNVPSQAASLLETALKKRPFAYGNLRVAFVALVTFLNANGYSVEVDDRRAAQIISSVSKEELSASQAIAEIASPTEQRLKPGTTLRQLVSFICNRHAEALKLLKEEDE
jgi:death-on-curing protein